MTDHLTKAREALAEAESAAALGAADRAVYLGREALKHILAHLDARANNKPMFTDSYMEGRSREPAFNDEKETPDYFSANPSPPAGEAGDASLEMLLRDTARSIAEVACEEGAIEDDIVNWMHTTLEWRAAEALRAERAARERAERELKRLRDPKASMEAEFDKITAAEDVLTWLLIEKLGCSDEGPYSPSDAQHHIVAALDQLDTAVAELARLRKAMEEALVPLEAVRGHGLTYIADVRIAEALAILTSALEEKEGDPRAAESDIAQPVQDQADPAPADPAAEAMAKALEILRDWPNPYSRLSDSVVRERFLPALAAWRKEHPRA